MNWQPYAHKFEDKITFSKLIFSISFHYILYDPIAGLQQTQLRNKK